MDCRPTLKQIVITLSIQSKTNVASKIGGRSGINIEFPKPEYWSGLPFLFPGDLPYLRIKPGSPALQVDCLLSEPTEKP